MGAIAKSTAAVGILTFGSFCSAQTPSYPTKPVRMIVPFSAGGGVDIIARILAARLGDELGHPVVVDNRVGAGSTVGTEIVARAARDGHTLLFTNNSIAYNPSLYPKLQYDTFRDLAAVGLMGTTASALVVHPSVAAKNVAELIALMKARPGQMNYGTGGVGGSVHLAFELFQAMAGVKATHIPYKGVGPALVGAAGGQVQLMMAGLPPALTYVKSNRLRALGVTTLKRAAALPEVPTIAESGVPGYEYVTWYAMLAPAAVPKPVIAKLNQASAKALSTSDVREKFNQQGVEPESSTPEKFAGTLRTEVERWGKIIKSAGITGE
jgi:tripartite-type tricarboxylate transporter receptor subunit TctC